MLTIHRASRADVLVQRLGSVLAEPGPDPFLPEIVAVPSRGVERWISQGLATTLGTTPGAADGVCAHVEFPSPSMLVADVLAEVTGIDGRTDPWAPARLTWAVLAVMDECEGEPWCVVLGHHVGAVGDGDRNHRRGRRVAVAQKLARLLTAYQSARPELVQAWMAGDDTGGEAVPTDLRWQAEILRRVRARLELPAPAERLARAVELLKDPAVAGRLPLPARFALFGPTRLDVSAIRVLDALAVHRAVHLFLPHPSRAAWEENVEALPRGGRLWRADAAATVAARDAHPLLATMGRDARELQLRLQSELTPGFIVQHADEPIEATSLLTRLQRDLQDNRTPEPTHAGDADDSLVVHSCHGRQRQVEVMRELVLGLLAADPTLELRDIVVMCPDIETYAPLLSATFGLAAEADDPQRDRDAHPGQRLRIRLADRALRETNPVLDVLAALLALADGRLPAAEVLDLAARQPVRHRFGFDDDDLVLIADWTGRAGVRWGADGASRERFQAGAISANTWRSGLDRLLLGVALDESEQRLFGGTLPVDDVDSTDIDLVGRLAEFAGVVVDLTARLSGWQPLSAWITLLEEVLDSLVGVATHDEWQLTQARLTLAAVAESATATPPGDRGLTLTDLRALLDERLQGRPTRANFRTGSLTVCSMVPMRSVPHRVVVILGLDDGAFPRTQQLDGDDVMARRPRVGERDPRSEDRQLLLDSIMAAQEHLVILYTGNDERSGLRRPPATPLAELIDLVARTAPGHDVVRRHPLQPFDPTNFQPDAASGRPFSFDAAAARGARALVRPRQAEPPFLPHPLVAEPEESVLELEALAQFVSNPVKTFVRARLGVGFPGDPDEVADEIPVVLAGLADWQVGDRLLRSALRVSGPADTGVEHAAAAEFARGTLPPGRLGVAAFEPVLQQVTALAAESAAARIVPAQVLDVDVVLPSGIRLVGSVPRVHGETIVRVEYSRLKAKHRIAAWLELLGLCASQPHGGWRAVAFGRSGDRVASSRLTGIDADTALGLLDDLVALFRLGQREPLPLPLSTSETYASARGRGAAPSPALLRAARTWRGIRRDGTPFGEATDAEQQLVWGEVTIEELASSPPRPEDWPAGRAGGPEPSRFGTLARRLWEPLFEQETLR